MIKSKEKKRSMTLRLSLHPSDRGVGIFLFWNGCCFLQNDRKYSILKSSRVCVIIKCRIFLKKRVLA